MDHPHSKFALIPNPKFCIGYDAYTIQTQKIVTLIFLFLLKSSFHFYVSCFSTHTQSITTNKPPLLFCLFVYLTDFQLYNSMIKTWRYFGFCFSRMTIEKHVPRIGLGVCGYINRHKEKTIHPQLYKVQLNEGKCYFSLLSFLLFFRLKARLGGQSKVILDSML